jgi:uncharacterized RDD family membrane protein YckC
MTTNSNDGNLVPNSNLKYASFQHRLGSEALDSALMLLTFWIGWAIWSLVVWGEGQTPAKKILKIRVLSAQNNKPATWGHMAVRQLLIPLTIFIASFPLNLISFGIIGTLGIIAWYVLEIVWYFTKSSRSLRDVFVKTIVVNEADNNLT